MIHNRIVPTLGVLSLLAACSTGPGELEDEAERSVRSAVINGEVSDASQDSVVLLMHLDTKNHASGVGQCTGTLIAPRLVLTARHCVADTDPFAACDADGKPLYAGAIRRNHKPENMYVFTGRDRPNFRGGKVTPAGVGKKILDDGSKNLCNADIALLVLEEPINGVPIAPVRLDADVEKGELITAVGWGVTEKTPYPRQRQQRTDVKITKVGPHRARPGVPPNEFEVGESICSGDSGGPAFAQATNAVVGVVSRGGNANIDADENDPASRCIGGINLFTKISPFKELLLEGYELAEAEPWEEGGPDPRKLKPGEACEEADECRSNLCLSDPAADGEWTCAEDCSETEECSDPDALCVEEGEAMVCREPLPEPPARVTTTGCSVPAGASGGAGAVSLLAGLLAVAGCLRRRR